MSDHIDGPRQIGDPSVDLTDLFLFRSPENPARTVFAADVFPSAGSSAMFSDAVNHAIVARRVTVAGLGDAAKFQAGDREIRFNFRFDRLEARPGGQSQSSAAPARCPTARRCASSSTMRRAPPRRTGPFASLPVFAPIRSSWRGWSGELKPFQNLLEHDNVLCFLVEFDTQRVLDPAQGSLFGVIAETTPVPQGRRSSSGIKSRASIGSGVPSRPTFA